jgi:hypothetical protein
VTDLHSLRVYVVRDAACGQACHCGARVVSRRELDPDRD